MDVRSLNFDDATFDVAIDKGKQIPAEGVGRADNNARDYGCHDNYHE
jgi:hypothetical protein